MPLDPPEYYREAGKWFDDKAANEAALRSVVSRAYYAAFLSARKKAPSTMWGMTGGSGHKVVANHYLGKSDSTSLSIGNRLNQLKLKRETADYEIGADVLRREAGSALGMAKKILQDLGLTP